MLEEDEQQVKMALQGNFLFLTLPFSLKKKIMTAEERTNLTAQTSQ